MKLEDLVFKTALSGRVNVKERVMKKADRSVRPQSVVRSVQSDEDSLYTFRTTGLFEEMWTGQVV